MGTWIKRGLLTCAVFAITWAMCIVYWSGSNHMPDGTDVILYLLVLPVGFLLAIWAIRKIRGSMAAAAAAAATAAAQAQSAAIASPAVPAQHPERRWTLSVAACALRTPHGSDAGTLLEQMQAHELRLELDPELTDSDGFPILAGRVAQIDPQAALDDFHAWRDRQPDHPETAATVVLDQEQYRTLALAADIARELGDRLTLHSALASYIDAPAHRKEEIPLPQLHLMPLLPGSWQAAQRLEAAQWLAGLVVQQGWPAEKITVVPAVGENAHPLLHLDRLIATSRTAQTPQPGPYLAMAIAAESNLGHGTVEHWQDQGRLLHGSRNVGQTPGEAAVGFILADAGQLVALSAEDTVQLHRASLGRRDKSADLPGRVDGDLLSTLAETALRDAGIDAARIGLLATDGDHRGSRTEETLKLGYALLPELDLGSQCIKVAADCGWAGAATVLTALALAHAKTAKDGQPSLVASNDDALERAAVILSKPVVEPEQSEQSTQAMAAATATA
ncbi:hypothetical protein PMI40_03532 [Herbaspirillum sp. YR522]|nr:hypothetical protein PMI40_03532 [Herbaspirillum sp. YR522]